LRRLASGALAALLASIGALGGRAVADDYVTVRGAYYREPSTRVIQPTVEVERDKDLAPGVGIDVRAHYLVDAITSASLAAGTSVDEIFTETRNEVGLMVRGRLGHSEASLSYKYSAESDYWSHGVFLQAARRFWGDTARVSVSGGLILDTMSRRGRTPECAIPPDTSCPLDTYYGGLGYTQILSPVALAQVSLEGEYLDGFQGNLYRSVPNFGYEKLPGTRVRTAAAVRLAYYIPSVSVALRFHYRYYADFGPGVPFDGDPWHVQSHMVEGRVYVPLLRTLDARLTFREYIQSNANVWCDLVASPTCYPATAMFYTTDPKLSRVNTSYPELQLVWRAEALADVPVLGWISGGLFAISYGRYIQNTTYDFAHVLQMGYTLPY
jgi:hypothetical protein